MRTFFLGFFVLLLQLLSVEKCRARFILIEMDSEGTNRDIPEQSNIFKPEQPIIEPALPRTGMIPLFHFKLRKNEKMISHKQVLLNEFHFYSFQAPEKACVKDSDCDTSNCEYCLSKGICTKFDRDYCDSSPCGVGDGDCDAVGSGCPSGLICGEKKFLEFHPLISGCVSDDLRWSDVCIKGIRVISFSSESAIYWQFYSMP